MIVLDASAAVHLLLDTAAGGAVAVRLRGCSSVHVPAQFDAEVFSAIRRLALRGVLAAHEAALALDELGQLTLERWPAQPMLSRALSLRDSVGAGDALYVALAEGLDAPLLTSDGRLARSHGHRAHVEMVA